MPPGARSDPTLSGAAEGGPTGGMTPGARSPPEETPKPAAGEADAMDVATSQEENPMNVDTENVKEEFTDTANVAAGVEAVRARDIA